MPAFFARSIAMVNSDLADAIAVVPWKGGSQQLEDSAIDAADAVIVYGSSQTTKLIAGKVAGSKPCLGYGAKVGLAFIGREALRPDTYADTVHRVAVDIATYDQQSCLAPQTVFVRLREPSPLVKWRSCSVASVRISSANIRAPY